MDTNKNSIFSFIFKILQGALIGLGAVLPGISGGVLCVIFGIYKIVMEFLSNPFKNFKTHVIKLLPYGIGLIIGFLGISKLLSYLLTNYEAPSICVFIGLIVGMLPSLFDEAGLKGRNYKSYISLSIGMVLIFALLISLKLLNIVITPNKGWYIFCGFSLALSIIAPGMSFSTILMPLGLYTVFIDGISQFNFEILIFAGIGALITIILLSKLINYLFDEHYNISFHFIVGVVIAATIMIIPYQSFDSLPHVIINIICLLSGILVGLLLDKFNKKFEDQKLEDKNNLEIEDEIKA